MYTEFRIQNIAQFMRRRENVQSVEIYQDAVIVKFTCPVESHTAVLIVKPFMLFSYKVYSVNSTESTIFWTPIEFMDYIHFVNETICEEGSTND